MWSVIKEFVELGHLISDLTWHRIEVLVYRDYTETVPLIQLGLDFFKKRDTRSPRFSHYVTLTACKLKSTC